MTTAILYHNPRCSKSRQALDYLQQQNIDFQVLEYLKTPLTCEQIKDLQSALGLTSILEMTRIKEKEFSLAGLTKSSSDEEIIQAMVLYPKLIERPILHVNDKAAIGRPLERIMELLGV
ncbi:arsenate reductase (glutaredoxin) [Glaciecola petra]|uniref:Arsenate reductase n=1 Tax=Glaciecola petra TaxID=3075602 RepID=A0ABU2ZNV3_9ALTE|nr:arsenate reductase (glutaredoxin) [Aestuariibacter sp. P117]MDT0594300.1 arsenate reductase (glutaredoxin) [Aestuariibacter sp. P117]